jgi:hypothetical protein
MNLPAASCGLSKGRISILIPLTLTLSRRGERESKVTLQRATGNYKVFKPYKMTLSNQERKNTWNSTSTIAT